MTSEQVEHLIAEVQKIADAALKKGDPQRWRKLSTHVTELKRWRDKGFKGECPVDYKTLGIRLPAASAARKPVKASPKSAQASSTKKGLKEAKQDAPKASEIQKDVKSENVPEAKPIPVDDEMPDWLKVVGDSSLVSEQNHAEVESAAETAEDEMAGINFENELSRAEELLEKGEFSSAISLAETILKAPKIPEEVRERAERIANEARVKRETQINALLDLAKKAFDDSEWVAAERKYSEALALDKKDQRPQEGLNALLNAKSEAEQRAHLDRIKVDLQKFNDIEVLEKAVREAEQLRASKKADDEILRLYEAGKDHWDMVRDIHGFNTTKRGMGDLSKRAEAVHEIEQFIYRGEMKFFDIAQNAFIPMPDALSGARRDWEDLSHQHTQKRLNEVERSLPHNLDWARERLQDAINQQYYDPKDIVKKTPLGFAFDENDRANLQARLAEIEKLIENRDKAEALRERARTVSPEEGLSLLMEARSIWGHLEGIDNRIEEQRELVAGLLADRMDAKLREAQIALDEGNFKVASQAITDALSLPGHLPGEPFPILKKAVEKVNKFQKEFEQRKKISDEFAEAEKQIRRLLKDPGSRKAAFDLFDKAVKKAQFKGPRLDALRFEIVAFRDAGKSWDMLQSLADSETPDWAEIKKLCEKLISTVRGGEYAQKAAQLRERASAELKIASARQYLKEAEVQKAEELLADVVKADASRARELKPLFEELEEYKRNAAKQSGPMSKALSLKGSADLREKVEALKKFRAIADDPARSTFTMEARREADELGKFLRASLFPKLREVEKRMRGETARSRKESLSEAELEETAGWAKLLREANLAWEEDEKRLVRATEMAFHRSMAEKQANAGQWDMVVRTWELLQKDYPNFWEIELEAKKARKQRAILEAQTALTQETPQSALDILREEQTKDGWGGDSELNFYLAEAYRRLEKFEDAERCALTVRSDPEPATAKRGETLLALIREDRVVIKAHREISELKAKGDYESALEVLKKMPADLRDRGDVARIRDEIILHAQSELLKAVRNEKERGTTQGIVDAVEMLVRLRGIEKLSPTVEGKSEEQLKQFRSQLPSSANQVIRNAGGFNPSKMSLEDALRDARRISNQLQAFLGVADDFPSAEWPEIKGRIQDRLTRMSDRIEKLEKVKELLDRATVDGNAWKQAIKTGNFTALDDIGKSLYETAGQDVSVTDLKDFGIRLIESMEIRRHIGEQFNLLKEGESLFLAKEDFRAVIKVCESLRNLPARSSLKDSRGSSWQTINQDDYLTILALADSELDFYDTITEKRLSKLAEKSGKSLLDTLSALAAQRQADLQKWDNWFNAGQRLHETARTSFEMARRTMGGAAEVVKEWKKALNHAKKAEAHFAVEPASLSSHLTLEIKEDALSLSDEIIQWRESAEAEIEKYSECASQNPPTLDDLKRLSQSRNFSVLAESLIRAKFNNTDETYYKNVLYLEDVVLRNLGDFPPLEKLHELQKTAERCLGVDDTLTRQIGEKIQKRRRPRGILDLFR